MWQRFFGPLAKIVGLDIEEKCNSAEAPGIFVRIGDQSDEKFLQSIIDEFGVPDVVLDDGSHQMDLTAKSFKYLYPRTPKNAVYMVEDLHTAYWSEFGGGLNEPGTFINLAKGFVDKLNADHSRGQVEPDYITRQTFGISFYDSIVALEKGDVWRTESEATPKERCRSATVGLSYSAANDVRCNRPRREAMGASRRGRESYGIGASAVRVAYRPWNQ